MAQTVHDERLPNSEPKLPTDFDKLAAKFGRVLVIIDQPASIGALQLAVDRDAGCEVAYQPGREIASTANRFRRVHVSTSMRPCAGSASTWWRWSGCWASTVCSPPIREAVLTREEEKDYVAGNGNALYDVDHRTAALMPACPVPPTPTGGTDGLIPGARLGRCRSTAAAFREWEAALLGAALARLARLVRYGVFVKERR